MVQGTDRHAAVQQAELAPTDDSCMKCARCLWCGVSVLVFAGEVLSTDADLRRLENHCDDRFADIISLLRAQHAKYVGGVAGARILLDRLTESANFRFVRELAVPFLVQALIAIGEVEAAEAAFDDCDFDG